MGAFAWTNFPLLKWISDGKSAKLFRSVTEKYDLKKHLSLCRGLRPKSREENFATESRRWHGSLGKSQGYRKETRLLQWDSEPRMIIQLEPMS